MIFFGLPMRLSHIISLFYLYQSYMGYQLIIKDSWKIYFLPIRKINIYILNKYMFYQCRVNLEFMLQKLSYDQQGPDGP